MLCYSCPMIQSQYKIHFARYSKRYDAYPLDALVSGRSHWDGWQAHRPKYDMFNRPFIISMAKLYTRGYNAKDAFLFGGIYRVAKRYPHPTPYDVELTNQMQDEIRRVVYCVPGIPPRAIRVNLETYQAALEPMRNLVSPIFSKGVCYLKAEGNRVKHLETARKFGIVFGHLDAIEFSLRKLLTELKDGNPANAVAATRVEKALKQYNTKATKPIGC